MKKLEQCKTKSMEVLLLQDMLGLMTTDQHEVAYEWLVNKEIRMDNGKVI
jgi:hypothetical protein